jgi:heme exporter protein C
VDVTIWRYAAPAACWRLCGRLWKPFALLAALCGTVGLVLSFFVAPVDRQQGEVYRLLYLHVPAAWLSMLVYAAMGLWAALGLVLRTRLSLLMVQALAPTGLIYCAIALVSGAVWGRPTWGTWWVWDARLTSQLLLLCLYAGVVALPAAFDDRARGERAAALLALVGLVNLPVIHFSVHWWSTLHQGASLSLAGGSRLAPVMLAALLAMVAAFWCHAVAISLLRLRRLIAVREAERRWLERELADAARRAPVFAPLADAMERA